MKNQTFFKFLFWFITACFVMLFTFMTVTFFPLMLDDPDCPVFMPLLFAAMFIAFAVLYTSIAIFVYRDAPKRGMKRWMWMVIVTFVPNFIGLIIYLIVRSSSSERCNNCGKPIRKDFEVCPYCSTKLSLSCSKCGKQVYADWKVCPYCKNEL